LLFFFFGVGFSVFGFRLRGIGDAIGFNQHSRQRSQVTANRGSHRVRPRETTGIHLVVAPEQCGIAEVHRYLNHIGESGMVCGENRFHVADHKFGLFFDRLTGQLAGLVDRAGSGYKDKVSGAPTLRVGSLRRGPTLSLNHVFRHCSSRIFNSSRASSDINASGS